MKKCKLCNKEIAEDKVFCNKDCYYPWLKSHNPNPKFGKIDKNYSTIKAIRKFSRSYREKVINFYSQGKIECTICKEQDPIVLCIDHIDENNKNKKIPSGNTFYRWLIKNNFPGGFQVLCHNCNFRKEYWRRQREHKE